MRRATALLAATIALLASPVASAAAVPLKLAATGTAGFPERAYVVTLPQGMRLDRGSVSVRENGDPIKRFTLVPARSLDAGQLGAVLVIDASDSMRGAAIAGAMRAARAFVGQAVANERIAVVTFNDRAAVALPFTGDRSRIKRALLRPPALAEGTHLYDAVGMAVRLVARSRLQSASIVVLSDGADTGSTGSAASVSRLAGAAHVRLFGIGLRSPSFRSSTLRSLAMSGGGSYSEASSPADLERLFTALGERLADEWLLRYRSPATGQRHVDVSVTVRGLGTATSGYTVPLTFAGGIYHRSPLERFWRSPAAMVVVVALCSLVAGMLAVLLMRPRGRSLRERMGEFVSVGQHSERKTESRVFADRVYASAEASLGRLRWWDRFREQLDVAGVSVPAVQLVLLGVVGACLVGMLAALLTGFAPAVLLGAVVPLAIRSLIGRKLERRRAAFAEQLPDNLQVLASAMRAGHSFVGALAVVVEDAPEPSRSELKRAVADEQLGVALDEALGSVVRRMDSKDLSQVALVATLQRDTGGNTAEVLDRVGDTIRERFALRRLVKTLTAQGRASRWIVSLLPVALLGMITLINPAYEKSLYEHSTGRVLLALAAVLVVAGSVVIKRIVNVKV